MSRLPDDQPVILIRRFALRLILMSGLWWVLSEGARDSWTVGGPTVFIAAWVSLSLRPPQGWRWRVNGLIRFIPFFLFQSLAGGIDVARRAFHPRLPLAPALAEYSLRLPEGTARIFFMNIVNLLPGTFSAEIRGDLLFVHVLDDRRPVSRQLERLESVTAVLFGIRLSSGNASKNEAV